MAITQDDFKKVWASASSVPQYTFSDTDYKNGWEFVGNLPPTRAMWDELQRKNDEKMQFLQENGSMCFDSVADMKSSNLDAGQTTLTKGYYSVNDGGSAIYNIRAKTQDDVDDGGSIIVLDNGNVAELIVNNWVTPEQFGAKGDGITDDTDALQNALNTGANIVFADKKYNISKELWVSQANSSTEKRRFVNLGKAVIVAIAEMNSIINCGSADITGEGFTIEGGCLDCNSLAKDGIRFGYASGCFVRNTYIVNAVEYGIHLFSGNHCWLESCKIFNPDTLATCIFNGGNDTKVLNCELYYTNIGILSSKNFVKVANTHIWSGSASNPNNDTVGIGWTADASVTSLELFADGIYLDSFAVGIDTGTKKARVLLSSSICYISNAASALTTCYGIKLGNASSTYIAESCEFYAPSGKTIFPVEGVNGHLPTNRMDTYSIVTELTTMTGYIDTLPLGKYSLYVPANSIFTDLPADSGNKAFALEVQKLSNSTISVLAVSFRNGKTYGKSKIGGTWTTTWMTF